MMHIYATVPHWVSSFAWVVDGWRKGSNGLRVLPSIRGLPMSHLINHRKRRIRKKWRKRITLVFEA